MALNEKLALISEMVEGDAWNFLRLISIGRNCNDIVAAEPPNRPMPTLQRIAKSSSRYYGADVVHSTNAKEKFRRFIPRQSAGPGR